MIHVCSLARLHDTVDETGARHIVTLLRNTDQVMRPRTVTSENHLVLSMDDIVAPMEGYEAPANTHVERLIGFVSGWDRTAPLVVHCYAGISRSTAGAFITACTLNPNRDEQQIAWALRHASRTATPNARLVSIADQILRRNGRMVRAVETIGPGEMAYEANPFRLDLE
jgi:predicted protein tyrosine phosphatase